MSCLDMSPGLHKLYKLSAWQKATKTCEVFFFFGPGATLTFGRDPPRDSDSGKQKKPRTARWLKVGRNLAHEAPSLQLCQSGSQELNVQEMHKVIPQNEDTADGQNTSEQPFGKTQAVKCIVHLWAIASSNDRNPFPKTLNIQRFLYWDVVHGKSVRTWGLDNRLNCPARHPIIVTS